MCEMERMPGCGYLSVVMLSSHLTVDSTRNSVKGKVTGRYLRKILRPASPDTHRKDRGMQSELGRVTEGAGGTQGLVLHPGDTVKGRKHNGLG